MFRGMRSLFSFNEQIMLYLDFKTKFNYLDFRALQNTRNQHIQLAKYKSVVAFGRRTMIKLVERWEFQKICSWLQVQRSKFGGFFMLQLCVCVCVKPSERRVQPACTHCPYNLVNKCQNQPLPACSLTDSEHLS